MEATYGTDAEAEGIKHLSAGQAGAMARSAGARRLVLTHIWPGSDLSVHEVQRRGRLRCAGHHRIPPREVRPVRPDGRGPDELREITLERDFTDAASGSVLITAGNTKVLCTAYVDDDVPRWMRGSGKGWVTAEYSMLPGASP